MTRPPLTRCHEKERSENFSIHNPPPQIEREVQFVCSYLPGSIGDKCEELVDKYGEKLIDALVKEEMDPKKVRCCDPKP